MISVPQSSHKKNATHSTLQPFLLDFVTYFFFLHLVFVSFSFAIDSGKYLSKYSSFMECNHDQCAIDKLREHFHCLDIFCMNVNKVLCKREEVLRHLKWHKKRNESLTHGFLRFSSTDDCSIQFGECQHNGKQTHYHCLQGNCDKVYISTSDVQMHSNYHRKDSAIMQEGWAQHFQFEFCCCCCNLLIFVKIIPFEIFANFCQIDHSWIDQNW